MSNSSRDGYNSSRSSGGGYRHDRGGGYRGDRYGGGRDSFRGGRGGGGRGPGTGRAAGDDSQTAALPSREPGLFTIEELGQVQAQCSKRELTIRTNGYEIDAKQAKVAYQYDIRWTGVTKRGNQFDLNKAAKDDVKFQQKQQALKSIFFKLLHSNAEVFQVQEGDEAYAYDSGSMFFTQRKIWRDDEPHTFSLDAEQFDQVAKDFYRNCQSVTAEIKLAREINPGNLNGDLENDRPALQYLEVVFSQAQRNGGNFLSFGNKFYDKRSRTEIEGTPLLLKDGVSRSIRIIGEPADQKLMVQMVPTKATFYDDRSVERLIEYEIGRLDDIYRGANLKRASKAIKGLCFRTKHLERNRLFVVHGLTSEGADSIRFDLNGKETSVADYYFDKYKIRLRHPELPCVVEKRGKEDKTFYPIEVLRVPENQRVPKAKQSNDLNSKIIRKCQLLPADNVDQVEQQREEADILNSNDHIRNTGVKVNPRQLVTTSAQQLLPPTIVLKTTQKTLNSGMFGMQQNDSFFRPATVKKLAMVLADRGLDARQAEDFCNQFLRRLELYGVRIERHEFFEWRNPDRDVERLSDYANDGFDYVLIIGDSDSLHNAMKYMELNTRLVTQNIRPRTVRKPNNSLFDNLAFKFNLKAGGLNWNVASDSSLVSQLRDHDLLKSLMHDTLFFGIDLSHPAGGMPRSGNADDLDPTCVGFTSNLFAGEANMSKGDVGYQAARKSIIDADLLGDKFTNAVVAFYRNSGKFPKWIVVYRAGLSEGEIAKIRIHEIPVLKHAVDRLKQSYPEFVSVKLTFIMANRATAYRIFKDQIDRRDRAPMQNVPPGTCVSDKIVTRQIPSFILISQRALIGTAHPTIYYVLEGADAVPMDHLRWVTYSLCYAHGIVTSPTALPSPLVSAADLSKRARNNFKQKKYAGSDENQSVSSGDSARHRQGQGDVLTDEEKAAIEKEETKRYYDLNEHLKSAIEEGRFWA